ncbi:Glutathione S-transferase U18 [Zostera marina]|uniref:glutathione transferase n=1 Tax=Zostera marina TaxID=29655 RepID=A0A0K9PQF8_ZOSMR|nr:Glutathione S-transferase U18 [Zostera marina]
MAGEDVKVLGFWSSSFVLQTRIALKIKDVSYEYVEEDLMMNKSELLLQSNPIYKKVPVLLHAGRAICESQIIVEYIDTTWNSPPILPLDPYDRSFAKFWAVFIDDKIPSAIQGAVIGLTEVAKAKHVEEFHSVLKILETVLAKCDEGKSFFGGDNLGYIDIVLGSFLSGIRAAEILAMLKFFDEEKTPLLVSWAERFCTHSAVRGMMPDLDKLVELSILLKPMWKAQAEATIVAAGGVIPT